MAKGSDAPVVIVGAGPCGLAAGVALREAGIAVVLFDKGRMVQSIVDYPTHLTMFSTPEKLAIGGVPFVSAGFRPTRAETIAYYQSVVATRQLNIREHERVSAIERVEGGFLVRTAGDAGTHGIRTPLTVHTRAVVIATGYFDYPNLLGVPGEDLPHVSHRFVDGEAARGRAVVVVGGGNSAVECAIELARCGARITLVHYEPAFVSHVIKPWILPEFERFIADGVITIHWSTRVRAIEPRQVHLAREAAAPAPRVGAVPSQTRAPNDLACVPADFVYLMTGYTPRPGLLGALGVPFDPETGVPAHDSATMETAVPSAFIAGVLASGNKANGVFIENGRGHGTLIAVALASRGTQ